MCVCVCVFVCARARVSVSLSVCLSVSVVCESHRFIIWREKNGTGETQLQPSIPSCPLKDFC